MPMSPYKHPYVCMFFLQKTETSYRKLKCWWDFVFLPLFPYKKLGYFFLEFQSITTVKDNDATRWMASLPEWFLGKSRSDTVDGRNPATVDM